MGLSYPEKLCTGERPELISVIEVTGEAGPPDEMSLDESISTRRSQPDDNANSPVWRRVQDNDSFRFDHKISNQPRSQGVKTQDSGIARKGSVSFFDGYQLQI